MSWYNKWGKYLVYPIAWILTIIFLVYIFPPESKYDLPSNLGTGLFVVTIALAAFNYGAKKSAKKYDKNENK